MVWPIVIAAAAAAAANQMGNEQARSASNKALRKEYQYRDQAQDILSQIDPNFYEGINQGYLGSLLNTVPSDMKYTPEGYQYLANPDLAQYQYGGDVAATLAQDSPEARAIQIAALADLQKRSEQGLDAQSQADFVRAQSQAGEFAKGREGAIINNMQARGMGGSGMEAALRMIASQGSADQLAQSSSDQAAANARERALATQAALSGAQGLRGQDIALSSNNADILNQFAQQNSTRRQQIANMNTQLANQNLQNNIAEQRNVSSGNVDLRNDAALKNMALEQQRIASGNQNLMTQYGGAENLYNAKANQANALAGAKLGYIDPARAQGAANADYSRNMYNAIGSIPQAWGQYLMYQGMNQNNQKG